MGLGTAFDAPDPEALATIGRPRPGIRARVVDDDDVPLPDGEVGELQLHSRPSWPATGTIPGPPRRR